MVFTLSQIGTQFRGAFQALALAASAAPALQGYAETLYGSWFQAAYPTLSLSLAAAAALAIAAAAAPRGAAVARA